MGSLGSQGGLGLESVQTFRPQGFKPHSVLGFARGLFFLGLGFSGFALKLTKMCFECFGGLEGFRVPVLGALNLYPVKDIKFIGLKGLGTGGVKLDMVSSQNFGPFLGTGTPNTRGRLTTVSPKGTRM